jgi:hypothetical protein
MNAYDQYARRLSNAWKAETEAEDDDDDEQRQREVIPPGGRLRVRMAAMDAMQRQIASQVPRAPALPPLLHRPGYVADACDDVQRHKDYSDGQLDGRAARADYSAYAKSCQQLSDAWRNPANYTVAA